MQASHVFTYTQALLQKLHAKVDFEGGGGSFKKELWNKETIPFSLILTQMNQLGIV